MDVESNNKKQQSLNKNESITKKQRPEGSNKKVFFVLLIMFFITIGIIFIKAGLPKKHETTPLYTYKINRDIDYKINLAPNTFYDNNVLESNKLYPSNLIDNINLTFYYSFLGSKESYSIATYDIQADLIGEFDQKNGTNKEVWRKKFQLQSEKTQEGSSSSLELNPNVIINYSYYNQLAEMYREQNKLSINAYLDIKLNIKIKNTLKITSNSETLSDVIEIKIPLNDTVTEVSSLFQPSSTKTYYDENVKLANNTKIFILVGTVFIILSIVLVILKIYTRRETTQEKYIKNINHILKEYADLIVTVSNKPDIEGLRVMNLMDLNDLIDVAEQNNSNIIHYKSKRKNQSTLYIIVGNYIYIYIVDDKI